MSASTSDSPEVASPAVKAGDAVVALEAARSAGTAATDADHFATDALLYAARAEKAAERAKQHEENALMWAIGAIVAAVLAYRVMEMIKRHVSDGDLQ